MNKMLALASLVGCASATVDLWLAGRLSASELESHFYQVSTPGSAAYGKYLSEIELAALLGRSDEEVQKVTNWLSSKNLKYTVAGAKDRIEVVSNERIEIPSELQHLVTKSVLRVPGSVKVQRTSLQGEALGAHSSADTRKAYNVPTDLTGDGENQMVWGPGTYGVLVSDVEKYWKTYDIPGTSIDRVKLEGYAPQQKSGDNFGEASLDTDIITGMAPGAITHVSNTNDTKAPEEGPGFGYAQLAFLNQLAGESTVPGVLSLSLGSLTWKSCDILCKGVAASGVATYAQCLQEIQYNERQVCMFTNDFVIEQANVEFMKLGLRGVTTLAAAGDGGMHFSFQPFSEFTAMGRELNKVACANAMPTFPASSPYVTAVGGTTWSSAKFENTSSSNPAYWSGGGSSVSWDFPIPDYQKDVVQQYYANKGSDWPADGSFNTSCRAYPDISALASGNAMCTHGSCISAGGTSAAAPTFAGFVTLLNQDRVKRGVARLGFLNPALYKAASQHADEMFFDVVNGNSKCNSLTCTTCSTGFPATKGFDLATGWGAPRWAMSKYL